MHMIDLIINVSNNFPSKLDNAIVMYFKSVFHLWKIGRRKDNKMYRGWLSTICSVINDRCTDMVIEECTLNYITIL